MKESKSSKLIHTILLLMVLTLLGTAISSEQAVAGQEVIKPPTDAKTMIGKTVSFSSAEIGGTHKFHFLITGVSEHYQNMGGEVIVYGNLNYFHKKMVELTFRHGSPGSWRLIYEMPPNDKMSPRDRISDTHFQRVKVISIQ